MVVVISEQCAIPSPGDSGGRTTSGGTGKGKDRSVSIVQLEDNFT